MMRTISFPPLQVQRLVVSYLAVFGCYLGQPTIHAAEPVWRGEVLPVELGVGYAVLPIDLSGDGKLDIAIVDSKRFLWLENPHWQCHIIHADPSAANDNVCFAAHDIDGDGRVDFAVGRDWQFNNSDSGGSIGWLHSPPDPRQPWSYHPLAEEPTTHRMRWMDWNRDGQLDLIVAPLKGRRSRAPAFAETGVRLLAFTPDRKNPVGPWSMSVIDEQLHVMHNLDVVELETGRQALLAASFEGVTLLEFVEGKTARRHLGAGQPGTAPAIGASEIRRGRSGGRNYLATIEPWHGDRVVVYTEAEEGWASDQLWPRHVLDEQLKWGHAVACANLDTDADEELIIGVRDTLDDQHRAGVRLYDPIAPEQGSWQRTLIEPGQVAVEDLATGDFDQDGDIDIVAVGRATHNAVIYWNRGKAVAAR
jgi:hypothetical protein